MGKRSGQSKTNRTKRRQLRSTLRTRQQKNRQTAAARKLEKAKSKKDLEAQLTAAAKQRQELGLLYSIPRRTALQLQGALPPQGLAANATKVPGRRHLRRYAVQFAYQQEGESSWRYTGTGGTNLRPFEDQDILNAWRVSAPVTNSDSDPELEDVYRVRVLLSGKGYDS